MTHSDGRVAASIQRTIDPCIEYDIWFLVCISVLICTVDPVGGNNCPVQTQANMTQLCTIAVRAEGAGLNLKLKSHEGETSCLFC